MKYGLINAIAGLAGKTKDVEEQVRLEEFRGRLLESSEAEFKKNS